MGLESMKSTFYKLLLFVTIGCNSDDGTALELRNKVDQLKTQINGIITVSTGETSEDCRTISIPGGNGCGPVYVYGVLGIDTLALERLFDELSKTQTELFNLEGGPVCDLSFPAKDSLIHGTCVGCYEGFECANR